MFPSSRNVPPPEAISLPPLSIPSVLSGRTINGAVPVAAISPPLISPKVPSPSFPAPSILWSCSLTSQLSEPIPRVVFWLWSLINRVPSPLRAATPSIRSFVLNPVEFRTKFPLFLIRLTPTPEPKLALRSLVRIRDCPFSTSTLEPATIDKSWISTVVSIATEEPVPI